MNNFIEKMAPLYQAELSPLLVSVRLAQACLESDFGQSDLAREALNFGGIKASAPWVGETYTKVSNEEIDGKLVAKKSAFRKYKSLQEFVRDHSGFIVSTEERKKFYAKVLGAVTYVGQCGALTGTYANDSQYGKKLIKIIEDYQLTKYDEKESKKERMTMLKFEKPPIIDRRTQALGYPGTGAYATRSLSAIKNIVWHYTATKRCAGGFITGHEKFWRNTHGWDIGGYHYYIDSEGKIYWNYDWKVVTYGAGVANPYCLHISVEANSESDYSDAQIKAREQLTLWLLQALGLSAYAVRGHKEMPQNSTTCPGYSKERLNQFRQELANKMSGTKVAEVSKETSVQSGTYKFIENVNVRLAPRTSAKKVDMYQKGETVNIENVIVQGGFIWGEYTNYGGGKSYVALGEVNGNQYVTQ